MGAGLRGLQGVGAFLGWLWYRAVPIRRAVARENVRLALGLSEPETEAIVRGMYLHLGRSAAELLLLPAVVAGAQLEGVERLHAALSAGRGAIVVSAHLGNWELLVRGAAAAGRPVHVLTKRMHRRWAETLWRLARRGGASLLHAQGSGRAVYRALSRGEVVAFVLDQHAPEASALRLPFFGRPASTSAGLARVALHSGAPVVPLFTWREPNGRHRVVFGAPLLPVEPSTEPVEAVTRACLVAIEDAIRAHPEQWLWIHRRWKPQRDGGS